MAAQIQIQDTVIELGEEINYNFQVGDLGEISKSKSTYTSSFKIPRLSEFEKLFNSLGIPSDRSRHPYQINDVYLLDDYVPIMRGVLVFMRTDELHFNVTAISGAFDFFTEIGETKFSDIDISEIVHEKTLETVADRIEGLILQPYGGNYTYGFANFGGLSHYTESGGPVTVNIDTLCPVVTAKYLWDKIFQSFPRFSFSGDFYTSQDFEGLWVVFPYSPFVEVGEPIRSIELIREGWIQGFNPGVDITGYEPWDTITQQEIHFIPTSTNWILRCEDSGVYKINIDIFNAFIRYPDITPDPSDHIILTIRVNGTPVFSVNSTLSSDASYRFYYFISAGDFVDFTFDRQQGRENELVIIDLTNLTISIDKLENNDQSALSTFGLSIRQFVKEIMWRYGLLAFVENNHIDFTRIGGIIESGEVVDWSDKYIRRTEEEYTLDYNQNNWLRHKYDGENQSYFDKNIQVDNKNILPEKTIIQSELYVPEEYQITYRTYPSYTIQVSSFPIFDPDVRTVDSTEEGEFDYKTQKRFFFARVESRNIPYRIGSVTMGGTEDSPTNPGITKRTHVITFDNLSFEENTYYDPLRKILDHTRVHRIELLLTPIDANQLSLKKLYYFEQEQSHYMLNKLQFKKGTAAKGEFIKISLPITEVWVPSGATCQLDGGYRTGWVEYSVLTNPINGATKPNIPSDPNYAAPEYDPVQCEPQSVILASNEDTDHNDIFRLFVDTDLIIEINGTQRAYITDVEQRTIPCAVGDSVRVIQRSNPAANPWPPQSRATLTIENGGASNSLVQTSQNPDLNEITFTLQPGPTYITSIGVSEATGLRKYLFTSLINIPLTDPTDIMFEIYDKAFLGKVFRGTKQSYNDYTSEFNSFNNSNNIQLKVNNTTSFSIEVTQTSGSQTDTVTVPANTIMDLPEIQKGNITITIS